MYEKNYIVMCSISFYIDFFSDTEVNYKNMCVKVTLTFYYNKNCGDYKWDDMIVP